MELGPAMQAGQSGLIKEFPAQNGPGEAQEFYAHVYNILGDPSLQVYVDTPNQFDISIEEITASDDFIKVTASDLGGDAIDQAVISIMNDGTLVAKGITDHNGQFAATLQLNGTPTLDIYANKGGFIQGHEVTDVIPVNSDLYLVTQYESYSPRCLQLLTAWPHSHEPPHNHAPSIAHGVAVTSNQQLLRSVEILAL